MADGISQRKSTEDRIETVQTTWIPVGGVRPAQVAAARADTLDMYAIKNPMRANAWYRAYLKDSARLVTVKCLGVTSQGLRFTDREQNIYSPDDFYFWKSAEEN